MKRQTKYIFLPLIAIVAIFFAADTVQKYSELKTISIVPEIKTTIQESNKTAGEIQVANVEPIQKQATTVIKISKQIAENATQKSELSIPQLEEKTVSIVMISECDPETEVIAPPVSKTGYTYMDLSAVKGFHILGNSNETEFNLVVNSRYPEGCEKIHYLDWDAKHPNTFTLNGSLGCEIMVRIFKNEVQVAQFNLSKSCDEEYIDLDLNTNI
jgi:hypothetical protein